MIVSCGNSSRVSQYDVRFSEVADLFSGLPDSSFLVTDSNVRAALDHIWPELPTQVVEAGEGTKSLATVESVVDWLIISGATRNSHVVAVGGGVVGDLGGFVAACFMRGIGFVQIPTSLLAMVDSAVGGKVGVNVTGGKNLVGAFWPPSEVRVAIGVLETLPAQHFTNGVAEIVKYGAIADESLFERLMTNRLTPDSTDLVEIIQKCLEIKRDIVQQDELETTGIRAQLNFGHTIGHALEAMGGYGDLLHGEAIAIGMILEAELGHRIGISSKSVVSDIEETVLNQGLPCGLPEGYAVMDVMKYMRADKKRSGEGLSFSLLERVGVCKLYTGISPDMVEGVLVDA